MGKRTLYSLESDIRRILEGNDFISTSDEGGKQWYMNLVTDLANFVQREIEKAREEGRRERIEIYSRYMELREKEKHTYFEDKDIDELNKLESELSKLKDSNMEKKEWKKKLRELSFMKGYYFKLEDKGLVEKKDDQLVYRREELEYFIYQELEKAREEGKLEYILSLGWQDTNNEYVKEVLEDADRIANELSKLKDNK